MFLVWKYLFLFIVVFNSAKMFIDVFSCCCCCCCWGGVFIDVLSLEKYLYTFIDVFTLDTIFINVFSCGKRFIGVLRLWGNIYW